VPAYAASPAADALADAPARTTEWLTMTGGLAIGALARVELHLVDAA